MKLNNALIVYTHPATGESKNTLDKVKNILKKNGIRFNLADRDKLRRQQFEKRSLIIAVGGDGTFLRAAQFVKNELIFGVNADVLNKEGFFTEANKKSFEEKLGKIINGKTEIKMLPRLEAFINGKKIGTLALNEFYIGPKKGYHGAKYVLQIGRKKERHKSSGILVTTPAGSYAWAKAAYRNIMPMDSKNFQFVVREPYEGKVFRRYKIKHGILEKNEKIMVLSEMLDGVIVADSVGKEYSFRNGSKATIKLSGKTLNLLRTI